MSEASRTALMVAGYRARATAAPQRVCNDPWAAALAGTEGLALSEAYDPSFPDMELWIAVRTAYIDSFVRRATRGPAAIRQVVVLGAGFDTRAARISSPTVRYFEVDTPSSSLAKRTGVQRLKGYPSEAATFVTCDFESEDFIDRLVDSGFDPKSPAAFVWEGVSYYLTEDAVRSSMSRIATRCHPRSRIVFDMLPARLVHGETNRRDRSGLEAVAAMGEPMKWGCNDPIPLLYEEGFRFVRITRFDEACLALTGTYERDRAFRFQTMVIAGVERPANHFGW